MGPAPIPLKHTLPGVVARPRATRASFGRRGLSATGGARSERRCHRRATGASSLPGTVAVCFLFAADSFLVFCLVSTCFATADFFARTFAGSFASSSAFFFAALIVNSFAASSDSNDWLRKTFGTRIVMPKVLW